MNTLLLILFIVGIACFLITGILVALKKPNMTYKRARGMIILSLIMIVPYIVIVGF